MNRELETHSDPALELAVYVVLLVLTALTLSASLFNHGGRIMAVAVALIIASMKASFIAFYYMGLRRERALPWLMIGTGIVAVLILLVGLLPDMTFARF